MKVKFTGTIDLPYADDRGSYDIWLVQAIYKAIDDGPELDDIYEALQLDWDIEPYSRLTGLSKHESA